MMGKRSPLPLLAAALLLLAPGCFRNSVAPEPGERFVLEYDVPAAPAGRVPVADALRIGRFSADPSLEGTQMAYRPAPFRKETDFYNRWIASPGALVGGFLLRDFRQAGAFAAVFREGDAQDARFLLQGHLESFEERDDGKGRAALLAATVTLLDLSKAEMPGRVLFQRNYRVEEPLPGNGARALAQSMSRAMARFSARCIEDARAAAAAAGS
jgi:ABC-type uncharacterized transport system auxiliary subunit